MTLRANFYDKAIAARIKAARQKAKVSQRKLAALCDGVTYQQIQKYESGQDRISAGRLLLVANACGVDVGYFFAGL